jgi:hypothetical protein
MPDFQAGESGAVWEVRALDSRRRERQALTNGDDDNRSAAHSETGIYVSIKRIGS